MRKLVACGLAVLAFFVLTAQTASAQVSCAGVAAFQSCTAYASGAKATFGGSLYHAIADVPATRDCPPSSPYDPSSDNWWTNDGACTGGSATATSTATATATTGGSRATATATATSTSSRATATATATATTSGGGG